MAVYESWDELKPIFKADLDKGADGLRGAPTEIIQFWIDAANERIDMVNQYRTNYTTDPTGVLAADPIADLGKGEPISRPMADLVKTLFSGALTNFYVAADIYGESASGVPLIEGTSTDFLEWNQANAETVLGDFPGGSPPGFPAVIFQPSADILYWLYEFLQGMKWGGIWSNSAGTDYGEYGSMYGVDSVSRDGFARNYAAAVTSFNGSSWISPAYGGAGFGAATDITDNGALVDFTLVRNATGIGQKLPPGKKAALHVFGRSATEFIRPYAPSDYDILEWSPEGGTWREPYEWNHIESFAAAQDTTKETRQLGRVGYENALPPGSDRSGDLVEGESYFQGYWVTYNPIHTDGVLKGNFGRNPTAILSWDNPDGFKFLRN